MIRNQFLYDQDNRIQKLYYDININTIFNRSKLRNLKKKFYKYANYIDKQYYTITQPKLLELQKIRDEVYCKWKQVKRISLIHNPSSENVKMRETLVPIFRKADDEYELMKCEADFYDQVIGDIYYKIYEIKKQQRNIYKHYRKCSHCEKKDMVYISGCKSKHKLCSECIYDKTECPLCKEDMGLVNCNICYEYKKELVDTGCENKHQTCKDCLDKIQTNKKRRGLDYTIRNGYHRDTEPYYFKYKCPFCHDVVNIECGRDEYYDNYNDDNDYGNADYESDEEFWRRERGENI